MTRLWYRHWLELRSTAVMFFLVAGGIALLEPIFLHSSREFLLETGRLTPEVQAMGAVAEGVPKNVVLPWGLHVVFVSFLALFLPFYAYGSGLGTGEWRASRDSSVAFTLSLPVSRTRVVVTRIAAGCLLSGAVVLALLVAITITAWLSDQSVSFTLMTSASIRAVVTMSAVLALFSLLAVAVGDGPARGITFGLLMICLVWIYPSGSANMKTFVGGGAWGWTSGLALVAVAATGTAALIADAHEY